MLDVTEERTAQRELVMLGRAVESTHELVTFHDGRGRIIFANAAAREFFGIGAGARVPPIGPSEFLENDAVVPEISNALHTKGEWSGELAVVGHRGRRVVLSIGLVAHFDRNGELEYYSALSTDLTEQRRSDAARRRSEAALRAVVQASPLPIIALDSRGTVHVWNRASEELFGWSAPEALGVPPPFVCDANREEFAALLDQVFGGKVVRGHRTRYARRDDAPLAVDIALAPVRDANDRVVTAVAVIADVSEQVRATEALAASEVWFRSLVQHSSDMVMVIGEDRKLAYASETACLFLGLDDAAVNRPVAEVVRVVEEDLEPLRSLFAELRERPGETRRARLRILDADEAARWIEITATNMLHDDAVRGVVVNGRDITESYEADAAVRDSEERLRALLSSVSDAITVLGADGSLLYSSPVADEILGDLPDESIFAPLDPGDVARAMEQWDQTLARPGMGPASEVHIRRGDGSWIDAEVIANNLLDDPAVGGIVLTIRDITERTRSEVALRRSESRLRESEARYRAVVDDQIELVCRYEPDTTITFANRAFAEFYGHRFDDLIGSKLIELHPLAMRSAELERLAGFGPGAEVQTYDDWELGADGVGRWYRWTDRAFLDERGAVVEFQSVGHDVTEEHRSAVLTTNQADILEQVARGVPLEETLDAIARTLEAHFPRLMCAVFLADPDGSRLRVGAAPHVPRRFVAELDGTVVGASAGSCGAAALRREPVYVADATTDPLWASHHGVALEHGIRSAWSTPITGSDGGAVLGTLAVYANHRGEPDAEHRRIFSLIARLASIAIERKAFEERLAHESMHDPLTGLPNRVLFLDRLSLAVARGNRTRAGVAVLFLDLDRFKNVNDSLGHDAGDELLVGVAHRLESMLRPGDTVARFGGDEFTILCEDLPHESARERAIEIAQRLLASIERPFVVRNAETFVGISIGIALSSTGTETADELLRDADAAMYHAKDAGRGRAEVFDDTMRARVLARHATENALHRAIERGELRLFFQPIVSLRDARCTGAEALVRWQHPERGLVLPSEFVPLAEETGLIVPLGAWVLEQAAVQAARWQLQHDDDFVVSINLSARQVVEPDLADRVADVIARTGVRPSNLCFEITETVLMHDADAVMRVIERMRTLGVHFAIDDFGTGYSSLGYLKRFSVDTVKIDRAFVDGIADDDGDRAIVSAVIGLAHELALYVVAEGVEREQQLTELVALGCDGAQGYFFAPPQPADDLRQLVSRTRRWRPPGTPLMGRPAAPPPGRTPRGSGASKPDETQL
ncbi:MAG TPA: EAL domain-containing protein [Acidimicrobiia bacterium]|nr:EAL domain-containing protein [Acidimicrobiia bacterium]